MNSTLKQNLKMKFKDFNMCDKIPDIVFDEAIKYAEKNAKKENLLLIESSKKYIDRFIVNQARIGNKTYEDYLRNFIRSKKYAYAMRYSINVTKVEEKEDEIYSWIFQIFDGTKDLAKVISLSAEMSLGFDENNDLIREKEKKHLKIKKEKDAYKPEEKKGNIQFLNSYLRRNNISLGEFANITDIKQSDLFNYLKLGLPIFGKNLQKLYDTFDVSSIDELRTVSETKGKINKKKQEKDLIKTIKEEIKSSPKTETKVKITQKEQKDMNKRFDIKFLNHLLIKNNVSLGEFSKKVNMSTYNVYDYIKTGREIPESKLKLILDAFGVSSYEELKEKASEKIPLIFSKKELKVKMSEPLSFEPLEEKKEKSKATKSTYRKKSNQKTYNISFLKLYLILNDIPEDILAKKLNIKKELFNEYLNGELFPEKYLGNLLSVFKVNDMKELIHKVRNNEYIDLELNSNKTVSSSELIDISFIVDYLKSNNIKMKDFASDINVSYNTLRKWIDNGMPKSNLEKLYKYFGKDNLDEIKEIVKKEKDIIISKEYDISFLKDYFDQNKISINVIAEEIGLTYATFYKCLIGNRLLEEEYLNVLLAVFKVKSLDDLKEFTKNNKSMDDLKYYAKNLSFNVPYLKQYFKFKHISVEKLSKVLDIPSKIIFNWYDRGINISYVNKVLEYFNVKTIDELNDKIEKEFKEAYNDYDIEKILDKKYDISFISDYFNAQKISIVLLANELQMSKKALTNCLNGESFIEYLYLKRLLIVFNVENYDELKSLFEESKKNNYENLSMNINESLINMDFSFLDEYLVDKGISYVNYAKKLNISESTLLNIINKKNISKKTLNKILNYYNLNSLDELKAYLEEDKNKYKASEKEKAVDISFFKGKCDNPYKIARAIGINPKTFIKCLNNERLLEEKYLLRLLNAYNVTSIDELKSYEDIEKVKAQKEVDLTLLKLYLKLKNISYIEFAKKIGVSYNTFTNWLNIGIDEATRSKKLLDYFNVNSTKELMEFLEQELIKLNVKENNLSYDISFLNIYLKVKNISISDLKEQIGCNSTSFDYSLKNKQLLDVKYMKNLLNYFNVYSYEELKDLVEKELKELNLTIDSPEEYDMSILTELLDVLHLKKTEVAKEMGINRCLFIDYSNGRPLKITYLKQYLDAFGVKTYDELKELPNRIKNNENIYIPIKEQIDYKYVDISFLLPYFNKKHISQKEVSNSTGISISILSRCLKGERLLEREDYEKIKAIYNINKESILKENDEVLSNSFINLNSLLELLNKYDISKKQYEIIVMLFDKEKTYTVNQICKVTGSSKKEIYDIYKRCLTLYSEEFNTKYNGIIKKILENRN